MRRRILLTILAVTTFAVLAFFVPAALAVRSRIQRGDVLELQREASLVATRLEQSPQTPLGIGLQRAVDVGIYRDGALVQGTGPVTADAPAREAASGLPVEGHVGDDLVAAVPMHRDGEVVAVVRVQEPRADSAARVRRSILLLGLAGIAIIAVAGVVGALLARRLSRPVEELRQWAPTIGRGDADPPPARSGIGELDDLGAALGAAGHRIRELLRRERSFSSHVAHQLRTPVAAMRVAVETELQDPRADRELVLRESLRALDRLESTIESMLALARHDDRVASWCDVAALVHDHADRWRPSYAAAGRDITVRAATQPVEIDAAAIGHILDVLLENALVHGSGPVLVAASRHGAAIEIDVGDTGLSDPRADPFSEVRVDTGHGIGLRLARTLAESEGGQLRLVDGTPTTFRLSLPVPA